MRTRCSFSLAWAARYLNNNAGRNFQPPWDFTPLVLGGKVVSNPSVQIIKIAKTHKQRLLLSKPYCIRRECGVRDKQCCSKRSSGNRTCEITNIGSPLSNTLAMMLDLSYAKKGKGTGDAWPKKNVYPAILTIQMTHATGIQTHRIEAIANKLFELIRIEFMN